MENDMRNIIRRISSRRRELGYSFQDLADKTGMSKSTLQRYETGAIKNVPLDKLEVLAKALAITPSYLMGWEDIIPTSEESKYTVKEKAVIDKYRAIDSDMKGAVENVLDTFYNITLSKDDIESVKETLARYKEIPCYPKLASAGCGQYVFDDIPFDMIRIDADEYKKADYAIQVNGDSMQPTFYDGDTLLVERHAIPSIGEIGIFIVDGMSYVKRMGNGELLSDNEDYPNVKGDEGICMGKVLGKVFDR